MKLGKTHMAILQSADSDGFVRMPNNKFQSRNAMTTLRNNGLVEYVERKDLGMAGNMITDRGKQAIGLEDTSMAEQAVSITDGYQECLSCGHVWNIYAQWVEACPMCESQDIMGIADQAEQTELTTYTSMADVIKDLEALHGTPAPIPGCSVCGASHPFYCVCGNAPVCTVCGLPFESAYSPEDGTYCACDEDTTWLQDDVNRDNASAVYGADGWPMQAEQDVPTKRNVVAERTAAFHRAVEHGATRDQAVKAMYLALINDGYQHDSASMIIQAEQDRIDAIDRRIADSLCW